ncbi:metallopeptidase family protein [Euzebya tangerina]|uniref:metallopeptidase family protein n=1 Tax=Euzebya tangerina TaxID=591198 RepID=UPI000E30F11C|nr:metallopeptidase family protein [Euzebya tangerina]
MEPIPEAAFEELVGEGLDRVPDELFDLLDNVVVLVEDANPDEPDILGLYEGIPLTEREFYAGVLPDRITIYRLALCDFCDTHEQLVEEVAITVVHEIAHHFGIDDHALHEWGWG